MKYNFDATIGNDTIIKSMRSAAQRGHINHAYIIDGSAGVGKRLLTMAFAKAILCSEKTAGDPCGKCISCNTLESGNHPDIVFVRPSKKSMGVEDIREQVVNSTSVLPYSSNHRIFIVEEAETMTIAAQNALLKTLEDGPKYIVTFLLSKNLNAFLPTILSRCVIYKIPSLGDDAVRNYLAATGVPAKQAEIAAAYAQGAIGRGISLSSDEGFTDFRKEILAIADQIATDDITVVFAAAKTLETHKDHINEALNILSLHFRDVLLGAKDDKPAAKAAIGKIKAIENARQKLNRNCNFLLTIEIMLLKLAGMA
jgi:DNA polymerase-3 subunit delta'